MSRSVMETLGFKAKETVVKGKCLSCGKPVEYRVNVKGMVYYFCGHVSGEGRYCADHHKWGSVNSDTIMLKAKGGKPPETKPETVAPVKVSREEGGAHGFFE